MRRTHHAADLGLGWSCSNNQRGCGCRSSAMGAGLVIRPARWGPKWSCRNPAGWFHQLLRLDAVPAAAPQRRARENESHMKIFNWPTASSASSFGPRQRALLHALGRSQIWRLRYKINGYIQGDQPMDDTFELMSIDLDFEDAQNQRNWVQTRQAVSALRKLRSSGWATLSLTSVQLEKNNEAWCQGLQEHRNNQALVLPASRLVVRTSRLATAAWMA